MTNEMLFFIELIVTFSALLGVKKLLGKNGLVAWVACAGILANLQVNKCIDLFGLSATLGNVLFASSFLATDMLSECYGKKIARNAVLAGVSFMLLFIFVSQISLQFNPSEVDVIQGPMSELFAMSFRTTSASVLMYAVANLSDVYLFDKIKQLTKGKHLWLRNNVATIITNCLENFGFVFLAFTGIFGVQTMLEIALTTCAIETAIAFLDTPFAYVARKITSKADE